MIAPSSHFEFPRAVFEHAVQPQLRVGYDPNNVRLLSIFWLRNELYAPPRRMRLLYILSKHFATWTKYQIIVVQVIWHLTRSPLEIIFSSCIKRFKPWHLCALVPWSLQFYTAYIPLAWPKLRVIRTLLVAPQSLVRLVVVPRGWWPPLPEQCHWSEFTDRRQRCLRSW